MQKIQVGWKSFMIIIICLGLLLIVNGCKDDDGPTGPVIPADPGPGNLAGVVADTITNQVISGLTVSVGSISTTTNSKGQFRLDGVGEGTLAIVISGPQAYPRRAVINTANGRSVLLDAIQQAGDFNLGFYRELARGNHPEENQIHPIRRWINQPPPTVYIDTDASATIDGEISESIRTVRQTLSTMVPVWSGGFYSSLNVQEQPFTQLNDVSDIPLHSFVITFDDSIYFTYGGALGVTFSEDTPDNTIHWILIVLLDANFLYESAGVTLKGVFSHELGHGFGFEHTSLLPSIMPKYAPLPQDMLYSEADQLHAKVMYRRSPGNTDIDDDPLPTAKRFGAGSGIRVHVDRAPNPPSLSPELAQRLQQLQGQKRAILQRYIDQ